MSATLVERNNAFREYIAYMEKLKRGELDADLHQKNTIQWDCIETHKVNRPLAKLASIIWQWGDNKQNRNDISQDTVNLIYQAAEYNPYILAFVLQKVRLSTEQEKALISRLLEFGVKTGDPCRYLSVTLASSHISAMGWKQLMPHIPTKMVVEALEKDGYSYSSSFLRVAKSDDRILKETSCLPFAKLHEYTLQTMDAFNFYEERVAEENKEAFYTAIANNPYAPHHVRDSALGYSSLFDITNFTPNMASECYSGFSDSFFGIKEDEIHEPHNQAIINSMKNLIASKALSPDEQQDLLFRLFDKEGAIMRVRVPEIKTMLAQTTRESDILCQIIKKDCFVIENLSTENELLYNPDVIDTICTSPNVPAYITLKLLIQMAYNADTREVPQALIESKIDSDDFVAVGALFMTPNVPSYHLHKVEMSAREHKIDRKRIRYMADLRAALPPSILPHIMSRAVIHLAQHRDPADTSSVLHPQKNRSFFTGNGLHRVLRDIPASAGHFSPMRYGITFPLKEKPDANIIGEAIAKELDKPEYVEFADYTKEIIDETKKLINRYNLVVGHCDIITVDKTNHFVFDIDSLLELEELNMTKPIFEEIYKYMDAVVISDIAYQLKTLRCDEGIDGLIYAAVISAIEPLNELLTGRDEQTLLETAKTNEDINI